MARESKDIIRMPGAQAHPSEASRHCGASACWRYSAA